MRPGEPHEADAPPNGAPERPAPADGSASADGPAPVIARTAGPSLQRILARASSASLFVKVAGAGLLFLLHVLLARILGPGAYGDYAFALTWVGLLALPCVAGLDTAALRFVAAYRGTGRWSLLRGFTARSIKVVTVVSVMVAGLMVTALLTFELAPRLDLRSALLVAALLLPVTALLKQTGAVLQGLKHVVLSEAPTVVARPLLLAACVAVLWRIGGRVGAPSVLLAELAVGVVVLGWTILLLRRKLPPPARRAAAAYRTRAWLSAALPLLVLSGANVIMGKTDILMLGLLRGTLEAGLYTAGSRVAWMVLAGLVAANMIVAPLIAELYEKGELERLQRLLTLSARGTFAFGALVALALVVAGRWVLWMFGPEFPRAYAPMLLLVAGHMANVGFGSVGYLMTMTGHERETAWIVSGAAVLNVAANLALIPPLGLTGAALGSLLSGIAWNALLLARVRSRLRLAPTVLGARHGGKP